MQAVLTAKPEEKKQADKPARDSFVEAEPRSTEFGASTGLPLFLRGSVQSKLVVGSPDDPLEREADQVAESVVRGRTPLALGRSNEKLQRKCACDGDQAHGKCPACQEKDEEEKRVHAKSESGAISQPASAPATLGTSGGAPLSPSIRSHVEPVLGADLSHVRVHSDPASHQNARAIHAKAFTYQNHIWLGQGQSTEDLGLLAHEIAHTVQQGQLGSTPVVRRALDPTNPAAWDWYSRESHRDSSFLETVAKAPGAAGDLVKQLGQSEAPKTDDEREAFEKQVLTLIRLNAVTLVGAHRNELTQRKQQFQDMAAGPPGQPQGAPGTGAKSGAADTAMAIRGAAQIVTKLNTDKEQLRELWNDINRAVRMNAGPDVIDEEYQTLWDKAQPNSAPIALQRLLQTRDLIHSSDLSWGTKKLRLFDLRNDLLALRSRQIQGIDLSLAFVYNAFPFLADLSAAYIETGKEHSGTTAKVMAFGLGLQSLVMPFLLPFAGKVAYDVFKKDEPPNDQTLLNRVQESFDRLIERTDEAIVKVGSGSINPLDLPGAVDVTRNSLPPALRTELDRIKQDHEVMKWAADMILALGIAVLTGLTGGLAGVGLAAYAAGTGIAAAGIGVAQLGSQLKDMLDRQTIAGASTSPEGSLLGVSAPSTFEWAMFGVSAALTAADLVALAREVSALRPHFNEEPHGPVQKEEPPSEAKPGQEPGTRQETSPPQAEGAGAPGKVQPSSPSEARILEGGRGDAVPSAEQIDSELAIVQRSEPREIPGGKEYVEEVELSNGHSWRRTPDGHWCRFSNGRICVLAGEAKKVKDLIRSEKDIDTLIEPLRPRLDSPPGSVKTPEDQALWELYHDYFAERVSSMRADLQATGQTKRELPRDFDSFRKTYTENPELLATLRGKLAQGQTGRIINDITSGKAAQNLGLSKSPTPGVGEVVYPDFVWTGKRGFTAVTQKSRDFRGLTKSEIDKIVKADVEEGLGKYFGSHYVRRRGIDLTGEPIEIDEVFLNYDPRFVPDEETRAHIFSVAREHGGAGIDVSFFEFR